MKRACFVFLLGFMSFSRAYAGDDASGPIHYSADFSQPFTRYAMSEHDRQWGRSLVQKLRYKGTVVHFVKTSLPWRQTDRVSKERYTKQSKDLICFTY